MPIKAFRPSFLSSYYLSLFLISHSPFPLRDIQQLLSASFAHSDPNLDLKDSYILLVAMDMSGSEWAGHVVDLKVSAETTIAVSEMQVT